MKKHTYYYIFLQQLQGCVSDVRIVSDSSELLSRGISVYTCECWYTTLWVHNKCVQLHFWFLNSNFSCGKLLEGFPSCFLPLIWLLRELRIISGWLHAVPIQLQARKIQLPCEIHIIPKFSPLIIHNLSCFLNDKPDRHPGNAWLVIT